MHKDSDNNAGRESPADQDPDSNKSFVKKVKSRVSGFIPTSLSKWFGTTEGPKIRLREELEEDDESFTLQPPMKRVKLPTHDTTDMNFISTPLHGTQLSYSNLRKEFQEPTPGPSGIKSRKLVLPNVSLQNHYSEQMNLHNGDKDSDSGESTSGYSSMPRIPSKEHVSEIADKTCPTTSIIANRSLFNTSIPSERSLFFDRNVSTRMNSSLSSRRPTFNSSSFGSPNFMDRTLSTKRIIDSPFYGGRTIYGGASAYSRNMIKGSSESSSCLKNFVQAKPVESSLSDNKNMTLSKTAKRILSTLEQYTSPSEDVKKIPNPPTRKVQRPEKLISKYTGANPYLVKDSKVPSNKELLVPSMSDLLKMKMKERLQDSTVSVRELATSSKSHLNTEQYKMRLTEDTPSTKKSTNKIKTKITSVRQKAVETADTVEVVKLPDVQLPISTLPTFDFTIPSPFSSKVTMEKQIPKQTPAVGQRETESQGTKTLPTITTNMTEKKDFKSVEYKFSKPLILAENVKSIKAINNFKFSEPVNKRSSSETSETNKFKSFAFTATPVPLKKAVHKNNGENGPFSPAKQLITTGSVMDILGTKNELAVKFKPAEGTWECKMCMIRNVAEKKKCMACETPRDVEEQKPENSKAKKNSGFGDSFKITSGKWECSVCMIRNDTSKTKCVACEAPKPVSEAPAKPVNDFGSQFQMQSDKWECVVCMVRNDISQSTCVACTNPKPPPKVPTGFGDAFKMPVSKWECSSCMVRNDNDKVKCVACETPKPGSAQTKSLSALVTKNSGDWECSSCLVRNPESKLKCVCCETIKPGNMVTKQENSAGKMDGGQVNGHGFTFGIKPDMKDIKPTTPAVFGAATKTQTSTPFTFGVKPVESKPADSKPAETKQAETPKFSFGMPPTVNPKAVKRSADEADETVTKKIDITTSVSQSSAVPVNGDIRGDVSKPVVSFGVPATTASSSNMFAFTPSTKTTSTPSSAEKTMETPLNKPAETTSKTAPANSTFTFASNASSNTNVTSSTEISQSTPTFGSPAGSAFNTTATKDKPSFTFNASAKPETTPSMFTFGAANTNQTPATSTFTAGNKNESNTEKFMTGFTAGSNSATPAAGGFNFTTPNSPSGGFAFSANKTDSPFSGSTSGPAPTFGAPAADSMFGAAPVNPAPTFGSPAVNTPAFGGAASNQPKFGFSTPTAPSFGTPSQRFGTPNTAPTFGTPTPAASTTFGSPATNSPAFGVPSQPAQNGIFNFGSNTASATPKTGFNFGASPASSSGGFNFGTVSSNTQSSGGFKFGASAPPAPQFNADIKPSFNFTAGTAPNAFTAQPQSGEATKPTQRVIRRALRRTQR